MAQLRTSPRSRTRGSSDSTNTCNVLCRRGSASRSDATHSTKRLSAPAPVEFASSSSPSASSKGVAPWPCHPVRRRPERKCWAGPTAESTAGQRIAKHPAHSSVHGNDDRFKVVLTDGRLDCVTSEADWAVGSCSKSTRKSHHMVRAYDALGINLRRGSAGTKNVCGFAQRLHIHVQPLERPVVQRGLSVAAPPERRRDAGLDRKERVVDEPRRRQAPIAAVILAALRNRTRDARPAPADR